MGNKKNEPVSDVEQKEENQTTDVETKEETEMTEAAPKQPEMVEVYIHKGYGKEDPNCYVSINGRNYIVPRGVKVMVPKAVADEIARSERAQRRFDQTVADLLEATTNNTLGK